MESIYETMHGNRGNKERVESGMLRTNRHSPTLVEVNKLRYVSFFTVRRWRGEAPQEEDIYV